ncbi:hypothetical protein ASPWEDRAFT_25626 [Aspergillus wentii DTO 134E9]|uniref:Indole-diterpene biosynthesis protein PaxU n=1 Tax=Aspergillus wentii DTO 134E9 TaxID=1073089 RepID=A0A1L9RY04_ASPWE|nr:uncharacterized protein ASPWEDRAFT_25626 [Aspergillus wentii DTO 134E9]KAI9931500.1 hypothetical protein MW887_010075 [Aspergillus wentii]OJJ39831.1 hypothetical protein ASPWEDRAFT_25626 [Aspergillus wentii DTO 134E9]
MATKSNGENPLAPFTKLSSSIYLQEPVNENGCAGNYPKTIVLAFWMNAPPRALAKYIVEYKRLAPSSRIIFLLSSSNDFALRATKKAQQARVAPAVEAIQAYSTPEDPVFLHIFSNGGLSTTTNLLAAYRKATGNPLCVSSMVLDSAPGTATISSAVKAFSFALPKTWILRVFGKMLLYVSLFLGLLLQKLTRRLDAITLARRAINDKRLINGHGSKGSFQRCYIYSDIDELVDWKDVEDHALEAESKGWVVHREKFQGSPHVSHMRSDPARYWDIVRTYLQQSESK